MSVAIVARRYARALLELGVEEGKLDRIVTDFETVADAWKTSGELRQALENPLVPGETKRAVVRELADQIGAAPTTQNALLFLVDRHRLRVLPYLARALQDLADGREGVVRAEVTTAVPLPDAYYGRLQARLERLTGKRIVLDRKIDPSLVAGVVTRIGDRIIDGSLRTRLDSLREAILPDA
ncbi:MAG TPA: ATP synthase F1 subunit delta [Polyangiaceae bacterium]|nr:ATP synthase F1 subunit delta [Polyangiaceae bacterium]